MNENQNNDNKIVNEIPQVISIPEVQVEQQNLVTNNINQEIKPQDNNVGETNNNYSEPPKGNKTSTILLVLLFVFLFIYIMGMPYIRSFIQDFKSDTGLSQIEQEAQKEEQRQEQEAESNKPTPTPEEDKTTELTCTTSIMSTDTYSLIGTQKLYYNSKNQILNADTIFKYTFTIQDETYNKLKKQCEEDSLKYLTHSGFEIGCSYDESNIEMSYAFDLKTFTPIKDGATTIDVNVKYKQDVTALKNELMSQGYNCIINQ